MDERELKSAGHAPVLRAGSQRSFKALDMPGLVSKPKRSFVGGLRLPSGEPAASHGPKDRSRKRYKGAAQPVHKAMLSAKTVSFQKHKNRHGMPRRTALGGL